MLRPFRKLFAALVVTIVVIGVVFVVGMRTKSPGVRRAVRRISRATRGFTIDSAGKPGAYASLIRHAGRQTGRLYETPVQMVSTEDGFVITLPYGAETDWFKNVVASGTATVVHEGETYEVDQPVLVRDAARYFAPKDQRTQRLFGVDEYLRVTRVPVMSH